MPAKHLRSMVAKCSFARSVACRRRSFCSAASPKSTGNESKEGAGEKFLLAHRVLDSMLIGARYCQWIAGGYVGYAFLGMIELRGYRREQLRRMAILLEEQNQMLEEKTRLLQNQKPN